jgi:hypothetical protein
MGPYDETQLRKVADAPTIKIIEKWHSVTDSVIGRPIPVVVDNRRNNPNQASTKDEMNTAFPAGYQGKVVLSVWLDSFPAFKPILLTHEVGHWVLKLQGFRSFIRTPRDPMAEGLFNDMASHRPLYALRKSMGHDSQPEADSRCDHDIELCSQPGKGDELLSALYLADDLLNCSWKKREKLKWALSKYRPNAMKIATKIIRVSSEFDLYSPMSNVAFREKLVRKLNMPGKWTEKDDATEIKKLIVEVEGTQP